MQAAGLVPAVVDTGSIGQKKNQEETVTLRFVLFQLLIVIGIAIIILCTPRIENQSIEDYGIKQVGENLYLKKVLVGQDRVYFLVDSEGRVISGTSTNWTVSKGKSSYVESTTSLVK